MNGNTKIVKRTAIIVILFLSLSFCGIGIASGTTYLEKYQPYNKLLLHANQSPDFPNYFNDSSPIGNIGSTVGTLTTFTSTVKWGNASMINEGTSVGVYFPDSANWDCTASDCTWMFWLDYVVGSNTDRMHVSMTGLSGANTETAIYSKGTGELAIGVFGVNEVLTSGANLKDNIWYQIVVKRNQTSGRTTMFVNGTERLNTTTAVWQNSAQPLTVGGGYYASSRGTNGLMDEIAFWKGVDIPIAELWPQEYEIGALSSSITANFTSNVTSGLEPLPVAFTDTSTTVGATIDAYNWSFDDGTVSSLQNPTHTFLTNDTYTVNLTVTNISYSLASTKLASITVGDDPLLSDFIANVTSAYGGACILFTDLSIGNATGWNWSFGDGFLSTNQNPTHCYNVVGNFTVALNVSRSRSV